MMGRATGAPGGWRGPEGSFGGLPRTFGLQRQSGGLDGQSPIPLERERLKRVAAYFLPYWRQWIVIFTCIAVSAGIGVLPPLAVRAILDHAIPNGNVRLLYLLVGAIIGLNIINGVIGVLQNYLNARVGESIIFDLRTSLFEHLQKMSLPFYTGTRAGEIVSRINNDVAAVQGVASATIVGIVSNIFTVTATVCVIFAINWRLAVLSLIVVPGLYLPTRIVGRYRRWLSALAQETQADMLAFIQERLNVGGTMLTKIFGQAKADADAFAAHSGRLRSLNIRQALAGRWLFMSLSVFSVAGPAAIYAAGGLQAIRHQLTIGSIIAFVSYLTSLYGPLANLANVYVNVQAALAVFERIFDYLDLKPEVVDQSGALTLRHVNGHIRFERVCFAYPTTIADDTRYALENVSFEVEPGERVALVGPSGAGKTTITYLVPRFLDPQRGRITLDGHDLRELTQDSLRAQIGMVTQETFLFHATVRENLLYARPEASEEEIIAAAESANIHAFIRDLPQGYDTVVGERAFRLSGGERQRLSIARALLKDPRILILDEATSNLDATSEHLIQQAMDAVLAGRTSLIVAHRLSTVLNADRILVVDRGRLVEAGRHAELLALDGLYALLYRQQFSKVMAPAL